MNNCMSGMWNGVLKPETASRFFTNDERGVRCVRMTGRHSPGTASSDEEHERDVAWST